MGRNKKHFYARTHKAPFIKEVIAFRIENPRAKTALKYNVPLSTLDKWWAAYREGRVFIDNTARTRKRLYSKSQVKSNAKYSYATRKGAIDHYNKYGYSSTISKYGIGETTLQRWIKLYSENRLKPTTHERKRPDEWLVVMWKREDLLSKNKMLPWNDFGFSPEYLTNIGKYKLIDSLRGGIISINTLSIILKIDKRNYYNWVKNGKSSKIKINKNLSKYIEGLKNRNLDYLGYRSIKIRYQDEVGQVVSKNQIIRVCKIVGYESVQKKKLHSNKNRKVNRNRRNLFKDEMIVKYLYNKHAVLGTTLVASESNYIWSADATTIFSHSDKRKTLKLISIIDNHDRSIIISKFTNGSNHTKIFHGMFNEAIKAKGKPKILHMDNGSEFVNHELGNIAALSNVKLSFSDPMSPEQNGIIESWHRTLKQEVCMWKLKEKSEAIIEINKWIFIYNNNRRHSKLLYKSDQEGISKVGNKVFSEQTPIKAREISFKRTNRKKDTNEHQ